MKSFREYINQLDEIANQSLLEKNVFNHDDGDGYTLYEDEPDASRRKFLGKAAATAAGAGLAAAGVKPAQASDLPPPRGLPPPIGGDHESDIYIVTPPFPGPGPITFAWARRYRKTNDMITTNAWMDCAGEYTNGQPKYFPYFVTQSDRTGAVVARKDLSNAERAARTRIGPYQPGSLYELFVRRLCNNRK